MSCLTSSTRTFAKDHRTTTSRWQGAPYFRRYGGFKTREFATKEELRGGYRRSGTLVVQRMPLVSHAVNLRVNVDSAQLYHHNVTIVRWRCTVLRASDTWRFVTVLRVIHSLSRGFAFFRVGFFLWTAERLRGGTPG